MASAYRVPFGKIPDGRAFHFAGDARQHADHRDHRELAHHQSRGTAREPDSGAAEVGGIAWDGGLRHLVSRKSRSTGGRSWVPGQARRESLGPCAFRAFSYPLDRPKASTPVMARATNKIGQTQTTELNHNPPGYHHNRRFTASTLKR